MRIYNNALWSNNTWSYSDGVGRLTETGSGSDVVNIRNDRIDSFRDNEPLGFYEPEWFRYFANGAPGGFGQQPTRMIIKHMELEIVASTNNKGQTVLNYSDHKIWAAEPPMRGRAITRITDMRWGRM